MKLEPIRQGVVGVVGLTFLGMVYPLASDLWRAHWLVQMKGNECEPMFLSLYVALGAFLLLAARRPSQHRSLIAFGGWASLLHATVMAIETVEAWSRGVHRDYADVVIVGIIGLLLLAVTPARTRESDAPSAEPTAALAP